MKKILYILLLLTSGVNAQVLFPLLDSASISEALDGRRDARFRLVKNGDDPLRDVRLQDLLAPLGCHRYHVLDDSGSIRISCDTIHGNDIIISPSGGTTLVWTSDSTFSIASAGDTVNISAGAGISVSGSYPNYTITNTGDLSNTNELELPSQGGNGGKFLQTNGSVPSWQTAVTSVGVTTSTGLTATGSPITSSGTINIAPSDDLGAIEALNTNGYLVRTGTNTWAGRTIGAGTGIVVTNGNGQVANTAISLNTSGVAAGVYGSAWKSNKLTIDLYGRVTSATEEDINDAQSLSLLAGGGTLKLTKTIGGVVQPSSFVQLKDSSITNEGMLSALSINTKKSAVQSNTSGSPKVVLKMGGAMTTSVTADTITVNPPPDVTISSGTGISVSGTAPSFTITNTGDVSTTNEGMLSALGISTKKSAIQSNTAGSPKVVLKVTGDMTTSVSSDTIILNPPTADDVTINAGAGISISGSHPTFTITNTGDLSNTNELELPSQTGNNGKFLQTNGTSPSWQTAVTSVSVATGAGLSVTGSPITTSGTITIAPSQDLGAVEGLSGTGYAVRTGTNTWANRTITSGTGISITNGNGVSGNTSISLGISGAVAGTYGSAWKSNKITIDATGRVLAATEENINDAQTLSLLAGGGTLKLTKNIGGVVQPSDFVQLKDSSITNEGKLSVASVSSTKSAIVSNTSTSPKAVLKFTGGMTTSVANDTIIINPAPGASVLEAKKKDRLGIIVVSDSIGFDYKKLPKATSNDTLGWYPYFDSLSQTNKKLNIRRITYRPYIDLSFNSTKDFNIKSGVDSTMRFDNWGFTNLFTYSGATGRAKYIGTEAMIVKIDAGLNFKWTSGGVSETVVTLKRYPSGGGSSTLGQAYVEPSTAGYWQNVDLSRVTYITPGDEIAVLLKGDADRTVRTRGYLNIVLVDLYNGY